jgi:hypothetical protein
MTEQELRIARLSKIMNSGLRVQTGNNQTSLDAYDRVIKDLEKNLINEKSFNKTRVRKQKLLELAEREQESLRDSIYKHHFSVLQKQIEEKKRNKIIEEKEAVVEKELSEETYKPKKFNIKEMLDAQVEEKKQIKAGIRGQEDALDKLRLDLARQSLESEMRNKANGKQKLQNLLRESWERTQKTNQMQKKIERLRRFGDTFQIDSEDESEFREYASPEKENSKKYRNSSQVSPDTTKLTKKRSRSVINEPVSKSEVLDKIEKLSKQQDRISREKYEILSYLDSKSQSKAQSRPLTVTSLLKNN